MATELFRRLGELETTLTGVPLAGGSVFFYRAGTTTLHDTYLNATGLTPNTNPVVLNGNGRFPTAVYLGEGVVLSVTYNYKMVVKDSTGATIYTMDDIPAATPADSSADFAPELVAWIQKTFASSPITLTAADAGNAYELDTSGGTIAITLPSAASTGNGKGFVFKKTALANTAVINGAALIDGAASITLYSLYEEIKISSNGSTYYVDRQYLPGLATAGSKIGVEGGQIDLATPASGSTLAGTAVSLDINTNSLRIFENGGTLRGVFLSLTQCAAAIGSALFHSGIGATQAQMEAAASNASVPVIPSTMHHHPAVPKFWVYVTITAGVPTLVAAYNVTSIADGGVGNLGVTFTTAFSSTAWADSSSAFAAVAVVVNTTANTAGSITVQARDSGGGTVDPAAISVMGLGDH